MKFGNFAKPVGGRVSLSSQNTAAPNSIQKSTKYTDHVLLKCGTSETLQGRGDYKKEENIVHCRNKKLKENNKKNPAYGRPLNFWMGANCSPFLQILIFCTIFSSS